MFAALSHAPLRRRRALLLAGCGYSAGGCDASKTPPRPRRRARDHGQGHRARRTALPRRDRHLHRAGNGFHPGAGDRPDHRTPLRRRRGREEGRSCFSPSTPAPTRPRSIRPRARSPDQGPARTRQDQPPARSGPFRPRKSSRRRISTPRRRPSRPIEAKIESAAGRRGRRAGQPGLLLDQIAHRRPRGFAAGGRGQHRHGQLRHGSSC